MLTCSFSFRKYPTIFFIVVHFSPFLHFTCFFFIQFSSCFAALSTASFLCSLSRGVSFSLSLESLTRTVRGDSPLVGTSGLEPPTSRLSGVRSNHLSYAPICLVGPFLFYSHLSFQSFPTAGGDEEDRTPDPLRAKQVLSQLSYTPVFQGISSSIPSLLAPSKLNNTLNSFPC